MLLLALRSGHVVTDSVGWGESHANDAMN